MSQLPRASMLWHVRASQFPDNYKGVPPPARQCSDRLLQKYKFQNRNFSPGNYCALLCYSPLHRFYNIQLYFPCLEKPFYRFSVLIDSNDSVLLHTLLTYTVKPLFTVPPFTGYLDLPGLFLFPQNNGFIQKLPCPSIYRALCPSPKRPGKWRFDCTVFANTHVSILQNQHGVLEMVNRHGVSIFQIQHGRQRVGVVKQTRRVYFP